MDLVKFIILAIFHDTELHRPTTWTSMPCTLISLCISLLRCDEGTHKSHFIHTTATPSPLSNPVIPHLFTQGCPQAFHLTKHSLHTTSAANSYFICSRAGERGAASSLTYAYVCTHLIQDLSGCLKGLRVCPAPPMTFEHTITAFRSPESSASI